MTAHAERIVPVLGFFFLFGLSQKEIRRKTKSDKQDPSKTHKQETEAGNTSNSQSKSFKQDPQASRTREKRLTI